MIAIRSPCSGTYRDVADLRCRVFIEWCENIPTDPTSHGSKFRPRISSGQPLPITNLALHALSFRGRQMVQATNPSIVC